MKIRREINGQEYEFELTNDECVDAYYETQHAWDLDYINEELTDHLIDPEYGYPENLREIAQQLRDDGNLREKVAYQYREYRDDVVTFDDELSCLVNAYWYMAKRL